MANHQQNGGRNGLTDENRQSWRPQDQQPSFRNRGEEDDDYRSWRGRGYPDDERYDQHGQAERYGQGQSGYSAGRYGDDRSQQMHNRNELIGPEERYGLGVDDRFSGRGRSSYGYGGHESERLGGSRWRDADDRMGYRSDIDQNANLGAPPGRGFGDARYDRSYVQRQSSDDDRGYAPRYIAPDERSDRHLHRGTGPHRGKGPASYQRSDERLRDLVCESLTEDDQIDASQVEVAVRNGEVTLTGTVDDRRSKREAEDCACSISGIRDVQNQLRVRDERGSSMQVQNKIGQMPSTTATSATGTNIESETSNDKKHRA